MPAKVPIKRLERCVNEVPAGSPDECRTDEPHPRIPRGVTFAEAVVAKPYSPTYEDDVVSEWSLRE